jgi:predicted DNA-binding transcriptional regulator YafY
MQISRLFEIVYILMNQKTTTAKELSGHFEVSQRTIYRDIEILCQAGIPIYTSKGKGGGIGLIENFVLNKSVLSKQEQNEILSALQGLKATNYTDTNQVLSKLNSLFGSNNMDWIEVDFSYWNSNEEDKTKFHLLKDSILKHHVIQFDYYNSYGQESHRTIEPRKLVFKGQAWYLLGYCRDRKDTRYFKISRIKTLEVNSELFVPTPIDKPETESEDRHSRPTVTIRFKVDACMAFRIYDEFPQEAIHKNEDGSLVVQALLETGNWLTGYLMSFEDHIEIMEPAEFREEIIQRYKNALKKYKYDV